MSDSVGSVAVEVVPDASGWSEKLRAQIRDYTAEVRVNADTTEADRSLEDTELLVDHLDGRTANVKVNVDKNSVSQVTGILSHISALGATIGTLGPGLIPLGAGALGLAGAFGGPFTAAAGGLAAFAVAAGLAVKNIQKAVKAGTALTPIQQRFVSAQTALGTALKALDERPVLQPLITAMGLLAKLLPFVEPLLKSVAGALNSLLQGISRFAGTQLFQSLTGFFTREAGVALRLGGQALGNIALGVAQIFRALTPTGNRLLRQFVDATASFAKNAGHSAFLDAMKRDIPATLSLVGNLFKLVGNIVTTLAPYGKAVLDVLNKIISGVDKVSGLGAPLGGGLLAGIFLGPEAGVTVGIVFGLVQAFQKLYQSSKPLQSIFHNLGDYFTKTWLPAIQNAAHNIGPALSGAFHDISKTIRENKPFLETFGRALVALGSAEIIGAIYALALAIRGVGKAFEIWVPYEKAVVNVVLSTLRLAVRGFELFAQAVLDSLGLIVNGAAKAFGWLPGIGGHIKSAAASFNGFEKSVVGNLDRVSGKIKALQDVINGVHGPKPFLISANAGPAISEMERVQRLQIADKNFNIFAHYNASERAPGPGGGMGQNPHGSNGSGLGGGSSSGGAGRTSVHVHLDDSGRHTLSGFMDDNFNANYHANRAYENTAAGQ